MDLPTQLAAVPAIDPDRPAWPFQGTWRPWAYLTNGTAGLGAHLERLGQPAGACVGVLMRNRPEIGACVIALLATKRCLVTLSSAIPAAVLADELRELRLPVVVVSDVDQACAPVVEACREVGTALLVVADGARSVTVSEALPGDSTVSHAPPTPGVAVRMLTSGTTGKPKRVDLPDRSLEREAESTRQYSRAGREDTGPRLSSGVGIHWVPLLHVAGVRALIASVLDGRMVALMERFDVDEWVSLVREHRPKTVMLVPSTLRMVYDADIPKEVFDGVSAVFVGTAPLDPEAGQEFSDRYGVPVLVVYGATEFAGGVAGWTLRDWERHGKEKAGSVGRANVGISLRVVDPDTGCELGPDEPGLLEVKAPQLPDDGWARTTDRARLDADGFLYILGRVDDVIIRGGLKVHAEDVIAALKSHPAVRDAAVLGTPDRRLGAVPVGAVELEDGQRVDEAALVEHLRTKLSAYQLPVRIAVLDELPRTPSLKASQPDLRELLGPGARMSDASSNHRWAGPVQARHRDRLSRSRVRAGPARHAQCVQHRCRPAAGGPAASDSHCVMLMDRRGNGRSSRGISGRDLELEPQDIAAVLVDQPAPALATRSAHVPGRRWHRRPDDGAAPVGYVIQNRCTDRALRLCSHQFSR